MSAQPASFRADFYAKLDPPTSPPVMMHVTLEFRRAPAREKVQ